MTEQANMMAPAFKHSIQENIGQICALAEFLMARKMSYKTVFTTRRTVLERLSSNKVSGVRIEKIKGKKTMKMWQSYCQFSIIVNLLSSSFSSPPPLFLFSFLLRMRGDLLPWSAPIASQAELSDTELPTLSNE